MFCPECGKEVADNAMFCGECGTPLGASVDESEAETVIIKEEDNPRQSSEPVVFENEYNNVGYSNNNNQMKKNKSKAPMIIAIVLVAIVVVAGVAYAGVTLMKQKDVENKYKLVNSKIESGEVVLSEASRIKLEEANKDIASWNIVTLNSTERQLDDMSDMVDKLAVSVKDMEDLKEKYDEQKNNEGQKGVSCDTEREACNKALEEFEEEIDNNQVASLERKKKDVEKALDDYENAITTAYENSYYDTSQDNSYDTDDYQDEEPMEVLDYVFKDTDTHQYTEDAFYDCFSDLPLTDLEKYALSIIAINEIYARHGMTFERPSIQGYFKDTDWYQNRNIAQEDINSHLNNVELKNIDKLVKVRQYYWELCSGYSQVNKEKPKADDFETYEYQEAMEAYTAAVN